MILLLSYNTKYKAIFIGKCTFIKPSCNTLALFIYYSPFKNCMILINLFVYLAEPINYIFKIKS